MFENLIINGFTKIVKFITLLDLDIILTRPQLKHIVAFMNAMIIKGFNGKVNDVADLTSHRHRTSIGKFLDKSPWQEQLVLKSLQEYVIKRMWNLSKTTGNPIYVIIDDTISEKTVPSSKAKKPTDKCGFHQSHLKNKIVYGHQLVTAMLRCGDVVLPYAIVIYDKAVMSKIQIATDIINALPKPVSVGYVLADSWYSCKSLFDASKSRGYTYIGALKPNRVIYPKGHRSLGIKINAFANTLKTSDVSLVKAGKHEYYVYTYQGKLNDLKEATIVLSWPKNALFNEKALRAFICPYTSMDVKTLLNHYIHRWPIEIFFRESKRRLGLDDYQIRSERGINRYFILLMLIVGLRYAVKHSISAKDLKLSVMKPKRATYNGFISKHRKVYPYNRFLKFLRLLRRRLSLHTGNVFYEICSFIVSNIIYHFWYIFSCLYLYYHHKAA